MFDSWRFFQRFLLVSGAIGRRTWAEKVVCEMWVGRSMAVITVSISFKQNIQTRHSKQTDDSEKMS